MTNEMLAINGLKYLFHTIEHSKIDEQIEKTYNTLVMIAKAN